MDREPGIKIRSSTGIEISFNFRGKRCRETIKIPPTKANLVIAKNKRASILYEIGLGTFNYAKHFPDSKYAAILGKLTSKTIKEALEEFLQKNRKTYQASTLKGYSSAIYYHLIPAFGHIAIPKLTARDIKDWMAAQTISAKRINNVLTPLRLILRDAYLDELIDNNPAERVPNLPHRYEEPHPFSPQEMRLILASCADQIRNLFQFAFWTGLRTSELIALEWRDIDWEKGVIRVSRACVRKIVKQPKTKAGNREVLLLPYATEALESQKEYSFAAGGRIFLNPRTNRPWETDGQIRRTAWIPALATAGVVYRNPYQTRHTYASTLLSAGENPMWVAQQMGHEDWGMIRRTYGRFIPESNTTCGSLVVSQWTQQGHKL